MKKSAASKETNLKVGDISEVSGNVNIAGGNITTNQATPSLSVEDINQLFGQLHNAIEGNSVASPTDKAVLRAEAAEIQSTVTDAIRKEKNIEESSLSRHFRNIACMAPDVLDIVVATLANPLAGLGNAAKKVAEMAKEGYQEN